MEIVAYVLKLQGASNCGAARVHLDGVAHGKGSNTSAHLVDQDRKRGQVKKHVGLRLVGRVGREAFAHHDVPVGSELRIEEVLDVSRYVLLVLEPVHRNRALRDGVPEHLAVFIGVGLHFFALGHGCCQM
eukprot:CAMPEP_0179347480 /NCGR_PEP_ID=MMETSP0797-20121207/73159_1 /TAXON_ID=47934 /ORGANISM="Dinophysis acuminata, Strain DAEP01" /LENGTH=129 /DNA_ID=CAMNT_0021062157 /DNA_START=52 /DNA_END=441 /DNA_ORIENTATION=+